MATDSTHLLPSDTSVDSDADMSAGGPDLSSVQLAAATGDAPKPVTIPNGRRVVVIRVEPGQTVELPTDSPDGLLAKLGADGNLAIVVDGRTIILQGYAAANEQAPIKIVTSDGDAVDVVEVLASTMPDLDIQTAAGPAAAGAQAGTANAAGGGIFIPFAAGPLLGGFDAEGTLKATQLAYKNIDDERVLFTLEEAVEEPAPTPEISIGAESGLDTICVPEDSQGEGVAVNASTDPTSHLTTIVISGFPIGGGGFTFSFLGLDLGNTTVVDSIAVDGKVTITFDDAVTTDFSGSFIVTPAGDSDVDLGTLQAEVTAVNNVDPTVKASSSDDAFVRVDAIADGDDVGDDGDADKLGVSIVVADGGDLNATFQAGEAGFVHISASYDDFKDGSEAHTLTVAAPVGFTFGALGVLPAGVSLVSNDGTTIVLSVDSKDGDGQNGVGSFFIDVPVTYNGGQADGATGDFVATVSAIEAPTDEECDTSNNSDTATQAAAATIAETPTPDVKIGAEAGLDHVCVFEDTTSDPIPVTASTNAGSHLTTVVISGFPVGGAGFTFDFLGLDFATTSVTDNIAVDGTVTITFLNNSTTGFTGSFTVTPPADSDVDLGILTATVEAANNVDPTVKDDAIDQANVVVDAVADGDDKGDDGDGAVLDVTIDVTDGGDANASFQLNEFGTVVVTASFDDFQDGSEVHTLLILAPAGFNFQTPLVGLPAGVTVSIEGPNAIQLSIDSNSALPPAGVPTLVLPIPVQYVGGLPDGVTPQFVAQVSTNEVPTDLECTLLNNADSKVAGDATTVAVVPTTEISLNTEGREDVVCVPEDSDGVQIPVTATTTAGSHLTTIVISGFPLTAVSDGWVFDFTGLDNADTSVDFSKISVDGTVTITFDNATTTNFNGSFTVAPPADSDVDLGILTATVEGASDFDPSVTDTDADAAFVRVDAVADGDNVGDDGDADKLGVTISVADGADGNTTFQNGEVGTVAVTASYDDFTDGSETHTLTVNAPDGFTFDLGNLGTIPPGVVLNLVLSTTTHLVFDVDSEGGDGVADFALNIPVTYGGGEEDGESGNFTATVTATETPTDEECDFKNNTDSASATDDVTIASAPTTDIRIGAEGNTEAICVPEDSAGVAIPVVATTTPGSHLTTIVISGFPVGGGGFTFNFGGLDLANTSVTNNVAVDGTVTITFDDAVTTNFAGSFTVIPAADSDIDLGTLTAEVTAANNVDPTVKDTDSDDAFVRVDAIADGDNVGDDGDADKLGVTISVVDGGDANTTFQDAEVGKVTVTASYDDFTDGSETHTLTVNAPDGFTFDLGNLGTIPTGVALNVGLSTTTHLVFDVDSKGADGVADFALNIPVTYGGGEDDGESGSFTATVTATETPTDQECDFKNNTDSASDSDSTVIASAPTTNVSLNTEGDTDFVCVPEDSAGVAVPVTASTTAGSHLTTIVISGFPVGGGGFTFSLAGLDLANTTVTNNIAGDGTVTITFDNATTTNFAGSFTVIPAADSDVDLGSLTATVTAANDIDPTVKDSDTDQTYVRVDAIADGDNVGDDGDADKLGVTISVVDGGDANASFQNGEVGKVTVTASYDDFTDGSETHTLTVNAPNGFTFDLGNLGTIPGGVVLNVVLSTTTHLVFDVDSEGGDGVADFALNIPVTYGGGEEDGESGNFAATVTTTEDPTDEECDLKNNTDSATANDDVLIAVAPTTNVSLNTEGDTDFVCVPEDSAGVAVPVTASTTAGSHLTTIVISGFPVGGGGFTFSLAGLDLANTTVTNNIAGDGTVTITFTDATTTNFAGSFTVIPAADSDIDLGTLTATVTAANNVDPSVTDTDADQTYVRVDAVADGDDGDGETLGVTITSIVDGVDGNTTFQAGETGKVNVNATFDDYKDGSETHTLTVAAPAGFSFNLGDVGTLPAGVLLDGSSTTAVLVFTVDSSNPGGVGSFNLSIPATYTGGQADGASGNFTATVNAVETPTDKECDETNNKATQSDTEATTIAVAPTTNVSLNTEGDTDFVCVPEDSAGVAVPVTASTTAGSHLTTIVISGFPVGGGGFTFSFTGLDLANTTVTNNIAGDGTITITFDNATTTNFSGSFTVIPAADSDVDLGTLTATVTAANNVDPSVTDTDADQTYVRVDAVADGDDGDGETLGVTITSIVDGVDGNTTFQAGETGKVNVNATFDDYKDGSETHTLTVAAPAGFSFNLGDVGTLPAGVLLDGSSTTAVLVFTVDSSNPGGVGSFNLSIPATYTGGQADGASGNFTATVNAVETPTDKECDETNNKATQSDTEATTINNDLATGTLDADGCVDEDLQPGQNVGDTTVVPGHIDVTFTPTDNETITGAKITIPTGWQVQVWDTGTNALVTLLGAGADQNISAYIANVLSGAYQLRPIPPADTDVDGSFTLKLDIQDPNSDLTNTLTENFTVFADAAADKPTGVEIILNDSADGGTSFSLGEVGSLQVKATFGDFTDGSETHTVTVTLQTGFTAPTLSANGTEDGFAYTYNAGTGVIVFTVPTGTQNMDVTFDVKAPTVGTLPSILTFTAEATAEETTISGGGCGVNDTEDTTNNEASTVATAGVPATRILNGDFITNTNVNNQQLLITFVSAANFLLASAQIYSLDIQGQEGSVAQDVGFNIDGDQQYLLSVEAAVNPKVILTDFTLENTTLHDSGNLQFELNDNSGGPDRTAYTWIMTPDDVAPTQGSTESTDGTGVNQTLTDATPTVFHYLYGAGGADTVNGSAGADVLNGGASGDKVNGLGGNDILVYDPSDTIDGGTGDDLLRIDQGAIAITKHQDGSLPGAPTALETTVDLSGKNITNVEGILITTEGAPDAALGTTIQLKAADVLAYSATDVLYVIGQDGDRVQLLDKANWVDGDGNAGNGITATGSFSNAEGQTFNIYHTLGGGTLNVDADVEVIS